MTVAIWVFTALVLLMIAGAVPVAGGGETVIFRTPVFLALLGALSVSLVACAMGRRLATRNLGFHLTHMGVVLILAGALVGLVSEEKSEFAIPLDPPHGLRRLPPLDHGNGRGGGGVIDLGFTVTARSFEVERHAPGYALCRPLPAASRPGGEGPEYVVDREVPASRLRSGTLDLGPAGEVEAASLRDTKGGWVERRELEGGWLLQMIPAGDREQRLVLEVADDDGTRTEKRVEVNHPAAHRGWRFYLVSYDTESRKYVVLLARRDPGRWIVIAGIVALAVGTAVLCLARRGRRGAR